MSGTGTLYDTLAEYLTIRLGQASLSPAETVIVVLTLAAALLSAFRLWKIGKQEDRRDRLMALRGAPVDRAVRERRPRFEADFLAPADYVAEIGEGLGETAASAPLQFEGDNKKPEIRHPDAVSGMLQRLVDIDADAHLLDGPLQLGPHRGDDLARCHLHRVEHRQTGPDRSAHQIEGIGERIEKFALVPALEAAQQRRGSGHCRSDAEQHDESGAEPHDFFGEQRGRARRRDPGPGEMEQPDPVASCRECGLQPPPECGK